MNEKEPRDQPLKCSVEGDELIVRVGIDVLAFAFEESERNNPFDEDMLDFRRSYFVLDKEEFANDVALAMNREAEDGSTYLSRFLDEMLQSATDDGSMGIEETGT